jgi:hypothetical protein
MVRALLLALAASLLLNALLALALTPPWNETTFTHVARLADADSWQDSWTTMAAGLQHLESKDPRPLYRTLLVEQGVKFQYPPTALLPLEAAERATASEAAAFRLLDALSKLALVLTAVAAALLLRGTGGSPVASALAFAATLLFYPALKAVTLGNVQAWITAALALALVCWQRERKAAAGVLVGLACVLKPHFALVLAWAGLRREWRFAAAIGSTLAVVLAASVAHYGFAAHVDYLHALSFLGRRSESFYPNQSFVGLLHRALGNGNNVEWQANAFPPYHAGVFAAGVVVSLALLGAALFGRVRGTRGGALDLAAMLLAVTLASPIAWEHHYAVLAPILCLLLPEVLKPQAPLYERWLLLGAYLLSANFLALAQRLAPTPWNPLQSYLYAAALLVFLLLFRRRAA